MLNEVLGRFIILDGVSSATIIRDSGEVLYSRSTTDFNNAELGAVISFVLAESRAIALKVGNEPINRVFVEFRDYLIITEPLKDHVYIVLVAKPGANVAQINMELKKNMDKLSTVS